MRAGLWLSGMEKRAGSLNKLSPMLTNEETRAAPVLEPPGLVANYLRYLVQGFYRFAGELSGIIRRKVEQQVGIAVHAFAIGLGDYLRRLHLESRAPKPATHRRQRLEGRADGNPAFKRHVVLLAFENHVRIMSAGRRQAIFAVDDIGGPARRLTNSALVALALIVGLVHDNDAIRAIGFDQSVKLPALLRRNLPGNVEQLVEGVAVARVEFGQLLLDEGVVLISDRRIPVKLAFVVRVKNAVIKARPQPILVTGGDKGRQHVGLIAAGGDVVVIVFGIPEAEAGHVLGGEHGIARAQVASHANPLANVQVGGIVSRGGHRAGFVVVAREGVHAEVVGDAEAQALVPSQHGRAVGGWADVLRREKGRAQR